MPLLQSYLLKLRQIHQTGQAVPETSYYPALDALFSEVGEALKPRVRVVINLKNSGAGIPDGGFFPDNQLRALQKDPANAGQLIQAATPERGVLEVKGADAEINAVIGSAQVAKYLAQYGLVLVCNLRQFVVVTRGDDGALVRGETFDLAPDAATFWKLNQT